MTIPEYLKVDIKNLYQAMLKEMATDKDKRLKKFTNIIKIYYPWLTNKERSEVLALIIPDENEYHREKWKKDTIHFYSEDIITLFGIFDEDNNSNININEFKKVFKSITNCNEEKLEILFKEADRDKNGTLDIIEFVNFLSKHNEFKQHLTKIIEQTKESKKQDNNKRLSIIFNDFPNSPNRVNWRPSLTNLKSPTDAKLYLSKLKYSSD